MGDGAWGSGAPAWSGSYDRGRPCENASSVSDHGDCSTCPAQSNASLPCTWSSGEYCELVETYRAHTDDNLAKHTEEDEEEEGAV